MKTGFVCASGFNVVATATRGGRTLIAVVLGALSGAERTVKAAQLLDDGFSKWGGTGDNIATLPSGNGGRAYSICDDVRRKGGGVRWPTMPRQLGNHLSPGVVQLGGNARRHLGPLHVAGPQGARRRGDDPHALRPRRARSARPR